MSDQHNQAQPHLSLEEELDVLEAVWKVGKEKGLDLLRPEQKKKLMDSGRMKGTKEVNDPISIKEVSPEMLREAIREVVLELFNSIERYYPEETASVNWPILSEQKKSSIRSNLFLLRYGTSPQFFAYDLLNLLGAK